MIVREDGSVNWSEEEMWNLDITLAPIIISGLQTFKNSSKCYPSSFESMEEWFEIIDKMIRAFHLTENQFERPYFDEETYAKEQQEIEEGLNLFSKYYRSLWS